MMPAPRTSNPSTVSSTNQKPLTHIIDLGIKDLQLVYYMRPFQVERQEKRIQILNPRGALYLQYNPDEPTKKLIGYEKLKEASFQITQTNIYEIKRVFSDALSWFEPENLENLFGMNDEGELIFNSEFNNLNSSYVEEYGSIRRAIQIMPVPLSSGYNKSEPGVILYITRKEFNIRMNEIKLRVLAGFLKDFSFIAYNQFLMGCYLYSLATGNVITEEQMQRRAMEEQIRNSNFKYGGYYK